MSLTPIPRPAFQNVAKSGNDVQLSWATASGLVYQVQYTSDLRQPNWLNLGNPFVATSSSFHLVDGNALSSAGQRFYRLVVAP